MRSRSNGGVIGAYALPTQNYANGVFFIHDAAIYNTGPNPIWPLSSGLIYSATGGVIENATGASYLNYKTHTFTSNGTFTVTNGAAEVQILLVGGGGPGGAAISANYIVGGGGGGGGVTVVSTFVNAGTTFTVEVGTGGISGLSSATTTNGKPSKVVSTAGHNYFANGGGAGGAGVTSSFEGRAGGSGGGGYAHYTSNLVGRPGGGTGGLANEYSGGNSSPKQLGVSGTVNAVTAGGGGGAGQVGYAGDYSIDINKQGWGGDGYFWAPTNFYYGAGGGGARMYSSTPQVQTFGGQVRGGLDNYAGRGARQPSGFGAAGETGYSGFGSGGGGACNNNATSTYLGGVGGAGTVIFCYRYK